MTTVDKEKESLFLSFSASDYFLAGVVMGTYLDWFTTIILTLLYILIYNKTIAGVESQSIARYIIQRIKGIIGEIEVKERKKKSK